MTPASQQSAIVIGATSGIGESLALLLSERGYRVGITGRRVPRLHALQEKMSGEVFAQEMDVASPEAIEQFDTLVKQMGVVDLVIVNAGVGHSNPELDLGKEREIIAINVDGFTVMANLAMKLFMKQGKGYLVGISSITALKGNRRAPAYSASKSYMSSYLTGLRQKVVKEKLPITITDIKPGYVDTPMIDPKRAFWMSSSEEAARQILCAIENKRPHAYITKRWRLIGWILKCVPDFIYNRI